MKKTFLLFLLVPFILGACGKPSDTKNSSTSSTVIVDTTSQTSQTSTSSSSATISETSEKSSESKNSSTTNSQTSTSTNSTSSSEEGTNAQAQLNSAYPEVLLPTTIPIGDGYLNIAADGNNQKLSVLYFALDSSLVLNSRQLNLEIPVASYLKNTFASAQEAKIAVNPISDNGGTKVDLGSGITGYQQGAAGSSYLSWQEGNWNLVVRASNIEGQEPQTLAKQVVAYLEKSALPAPKDSGQITLDLNNTGAKANQVVWQDGAVVYTVTHQDPMSALEMAVSMNQ